MEYVNEQHARNHELLLRGIEAFVEGQEPVQSGSCHVTAKTMLAALDWYDRQLQKDIDTILKITEGMVKLIPPETIERMRQGRPFYRR